MSAIGAELAVGVKRTDLADPLGVLGEEQLQRVQLLRHTLDVVEAVHADNEFDALEAALKRLDARLNRLFLEVLSKESVPLQLR